MFGGSWRKDENIMIGTGTLPDLGGQIHPLIQALPLAVQPRLMAHLERAAADR